MVQVPQKVKVYWKVPELSYLQQMKYTSQAFIDTMNGYTAQVQNHTKFLLELNARNQGGFQGTFFQNIWYNF